MMIPYYVHYYKLAFQTCSERNRQVNIVKTSHRVIELHETHFVAAD